MWQEIVIFFDFSLIGGGGILFMKEYDRVFEGKEFDCFFMLLKVLVMLVYVIDRDYVYKRKIMIDLLNCSYWIYYIK